MSKFKAYADDNSNVVKMMKFVYDLAENIVGKEEILVANWLPAGSPFPTMFSKAFFFKVVESWDCVVKG